MSLVGFKARNHRQQVAKRGPNPKVDDRQTSPEVFDPLKARFGFTIDVAASLHNRKCERFYSIGVDGLAQSWAGERVWCNPPYSDIAPWVNKAWAEADHRGDRDAAPREPHGAGVVAGDGRAVPRPPRLPAAYRVLPWTAAVHRARRHRGWHERAATVRVLPADLERGGRSTPAPVTTPAFFARRSRRARLRDRRPRGGDMTQGSEREPATMKASDHGRSRAVKVRYPWWYTFAQGRIYRPLMKVAHRFGFCYPRPTLVEPGSMWCDWCGLRGRVAVSTWERSLKFTSPAISSSGGKA